MRCTAEKRNCVQNCHIKGGEGESVIFYSTSFSCKFLVFYVVALMLFVRIGTDLVSSRETLGSRCITSEDLGSQNMENRVVLLLAPNYLS